MKKNYTLSMDDEVYDIFRAVCDIDRLSYSAVVESLLMYYIEKKEQEILNARSNQSGE